MLNKKDIYSIFLFSCFMGINVDIWQLKTFQPMTDLMVSMKPTHSVSMVVDRW